MSIPNIIHFIYGLEKDFGNKQFCLSHYLAIKSAYQINQPDIIFLYYCYEPKDNIWWEKAKQYVELEYVSPPESIYGNKLYHLAHKADVIRLQKLIERGGIYLDIDTICVKPFEPLRKFSFVMGIESDNDEIKGLCNAVMLAEKNALFPQVWLETYQWFRSKGFDSYWGEHSIHVPYQLALQVDELKNHIHIEPFYSFFYLYYRENDLRKMFIENIRLEDVFCLHLWETFSYNYYLKNLTIEHIMNVDTTYNIIARKFL